MFEDLDWKSAFKRAAFAAALYLLFIYVLSIAFPDSFGADVTSALVIALLFFFVYAPVFAFAERRKKRRFAELKAQKKGKPSAKGTAGTAAESDVDDEDDSLRGRHNPNTSRKKAARRRRR